MVGRGCILISGGFWRLFGGWSVWAGGGGWTLGWGSVEPLTFSTVPDLKLIPAARFSVMLGTMISSSAVVLLVSLPKVLPPRCAVKLFLLWGRGYLL